MVNLILKFSGFSIGLLLLSPFTYGVEEDEALPILLDAKSSSFNQRNETVEFQDLQITQGDIMIRSDEAVASGLDFDRSEWRFNGNVRISVGSANIVANSAELTFEAHKLVVVNLQGNPVEFEDLSESRAQPIRGSANLLSYYSEDNTLRMTEGARLSEGSNDIAGCDLIYDLNQKKLTSGSSECGTPLVITIVPPANGVTPENSPLQ